MTKAAIIRAMGDMRRKPLLLQQQFDTFSSPPSNHKDLPQLGTHYALTDLFNRLFFETEFNRLEKGRLFPISIIVADIDHLQGINEKPDYNAGDRILINFACLFNRSFRQEDLISRYGKDE